MGGILSKSSFVSDPDQYATRVPPSNEGEDSSELKWKEYDYIVVGGGTAGCVIASRLSEDRNATVLLIEAGQSEGNLFTQIPLAFTKSYRTDVDWDYNTIPQKHLAGKQIYWARGKLLGGTSMLNACIYHRCFPEDFDNWAAQGASGWSYADLEPYFRKVEKYAPGRIPPTVNLDDKGQSGPWGVGYDTEAASVISKIHEACEAVGVAPVGDLNAKQPSLGYAQLPGVIDDHGRRISSSRAYLTPHVLARPNLTVAVNTVVERVLFSKDGEHLRAVGAQLVSSPASPSYRVSAKKDVVLSGGVVGSAQLLLLSGVGPKEELEAAGVECVRHLGSVGKHLTDHPSSGPLIFRTKPGLTFDSLNAPLTGAFALFKWLVRGTGPFSTMGVPSAAFLRVDDAQLFDTTIGEVKDRTSGPNSPDLEFMWTPAVVPDYFTPGNPKVHGVTFASIALKPESEGSIILKSRSVWDKPIIDGNYFGSESDVNVVLRGARLLMRIARTEPLRSVLELQSSNTDQNSIFWFGDADPDKITDDELRAFIHKNGAPACHPVGTCRMGTSPDDSVVDANLKVHGISGLRVMDASVFPTQVSGHPVAAIAAMSEKLVDMMKGRV